MIQIAKCFFLSFFLAASMLLTGWHMIKPDRYFQLLLTVNKTCPTTAVTFFVGYKYFHPMTMMMHMFIQPAAHSVWRRSILESA
jgi:hypothetical protein